MAELAIDGSEQPVGKADELPDTKGLADASLDVPGAVALTEQRNPRTVAIDTVPTLEILSLLNAEDATVPKAVAKILPLLGQLVDAAVPRIERGGKLHYFGAGTSGRIAMLDAAELRPTFGVDSGFVTAHIAGGDVAVRSAVEGAEDDSEAGKAAAHSLGAEDVVLGVSASGSAPFVAAAMMEARSRGALTALISCYSGSPLGDKVDFHLAVETGPEPLAGSTRIKAGTAAKLVLNGFSTALMVRLGHCYSNMLVDLIPSNRNLRGRLVRILVQATGAEEQRCRQALADAGDDVKVALVSMLAGTGPVAAREALQTKAGQVRAALAALAASAPDQTTERS